jgi:hypothetical protein
VLGTYPCSHTPLSLEQQIGAGAGATDALLGLVVALKPDRCTAMARRLQHCKVADTMRWIVASM